MGSEGDSVGGAAARRGMTGEAGAIVAPQEDHMALTITDACISCGACESVCPNEAIAVRVDQYAILPDRCTECVGFYAEPACQAACPVECCLPDPDRQESEEALVQKALDLHPDDDELEKRVERPNFPSHFRS